MRYAVVTPPNAEPIALNDAKDHINQTRDDTSADVSVLSPIITAAREYAENVTGRAFAPQTLQAYPMNWREAQERLPRAPVSQITSITYYDEDGNEHGLTDYAFDATDNRVYIARSPSERLRAYAPITITYTSGADALPKTARQAMLMLIAHWYDNRSAVKVTESGVNVVSDEIAIAATRLLNQHKESGWF